MTFIAIPVCKQVFFEGGPSRLQLVSCCSHLWTAAEQDPSGSVLEVFYNSSAGVSPVAEEVVQDEGEPRSSSQPLLWSPRDLGITAKQG